MENQIIVARNWWGTRCLWLYKDSTRNPCNGIIILHLVVICTYESTHKIAYIYIYIYIYIHTQTYIHTTAYKTGEI